MSGNTELLTKLEAFVKKPSTPLIIRDGVGDNAGSGSAFLFTSGHEKDTGIADYLGSGQESMSKTHSLLSRLMNSSHASSIEKITQDFHEAAINVKKPDAGPDTVPVITEATRPAAVKTPPQDIIADTLAHPSSYTRRLTNNFLDRNKLNPVSKRVATTADPALKDISLLATKDNLQALEAKYAMSISSNIVTSKGLLYSPIGSALDSVLSSDVALRDSVAKALHDKYSANNSTVNDINRDTVLPLVGGDSEVATAIVKEVQDRHRAYSEAYKTGPMLGKNLSLGELVGVGARFSTMDAIRVGVKPDALSYHEKYDGFSQEHGMDALDALLEDNNISKNIIDGTILYTGDGKAVDIGLIYACARHLPIKSDDKNYYLGEKGSVVIPKESSKGEPTTTTAEKLKLLDEFQKMIVDDGISGKDTVLNNLINFQNSGKPEVSGVLGHVKIEADSDSSRDYFSDASTISAMQDTATALSGMYDGVISSIQKEGGVRLLNNDTIVGENADEVSKNRAILTGKLAALISNPNEVDSMVEAALSPLNMTKSTLAIVSEQTKRVMMSGLKKYAKSLEISFDKDGEEKTSTKKLGGIFEDLGAIPAIRAIVDKEVQGGRSVELIHPRSSIQSVSQFASHFGNDGFADGAALKANLESNLDTEESRASVKALKDMGIGDDESRRDNVDKRVVDVPTFAVKDKDGNIVKIHSIGSFSHSDGGNGVGDLIHMQHYADNTGMTDRPGHTPAVSSGYLEAKFSDESRHQVGHFNSTGRYIGELGKATIGAKTLRINDVVGVEFSGGSDTTDAKSKVGKIKFGLPKGEIAVGTYAKNLRSGKSRTLGLLGRMK